MLIRERVNIAVLFLPSHSYVSIWNDEEKILLNLKFIAVFIFCISLDYWTGF
jgi:hypothetical protein